LLKTGIAVKIFFFKLLIGAAHQLTPEQIGATAHVHYTDFCLNICFQMPILFEIV
jgi:hypothetical protein